MASWAHNPDSVKEENIDFPVTIVEFKTGLEVRTIDRAIPRRSWVCYFNADTEADIVSHFVAQQGSFLPFVFTHPETSATYLVRYKEGTYPRKKLVKDLYEVEVSIIEVLGES